MPAAATNRLLRLFPGTCLSKIFSYEEERQRNVHIILVNEKLDF